jgi:hypothetical protein
LKANKVNLFLSSALFVFWYHSPNFLHATYMELLVKPEILTSYVYGPTFGNAEIRLFLFVAQCFNTESMQKAYPNYRWDLIRYVKGYRVNLLFKHGIESSCRKFIIQNWTLWRRNFLLNFSTSCI